VRDGWIGGWRVRNGLIGGRDGWMVRARGEYRFSSLMKLTKLEENYAFFYFAGKRIFFNIYDVIVKQKKNAPLFTTLSHTHTLQHT